MQSRLSPHPAQPTPTSTPILHIALGYKMDVPPSLFPLTSSPCLLCSSPVFPTYNSISRHHNLSISLARPSGLRGLEMETGFVSQLTALLLCFLADHSGQSVFEEKSISVCPDMDVLDVF